MSLLGEGWGECFVVHSELLLIRVSLFTALGASLEGSETLLCVVRVVEEDRLRKGQRQELVRATIGRPFDVINVDTEFR